MSKTCLKSGFFWGTVSVLIELGRNFEWKKTEGEHSI